MPESELNNPIVLKRSEHTVSRKRIDPNALKVLYRLHNHGYTAYLVGGSVRDLLIGKPPKDFDVATDARPSQVKKLFANSRIVGRRFRLAHILFRGGQVIEVSTFRRKSEWSQENPDSPIVKNENTYGTEAEDARRRDLTINGLFYNIADYTVIDYVDGLKDLKAGVIRVIGDAHERLLEDPVRMIRVIRHAARTGFNIDSDAWKVICEDGEMIRQCAAPRIREEFMRELRYGWSQPSFDMMIETGLLYSLFEPYKAALEGKRGIRVRAHLESNLSGIDKIISQRSEISDQELLAAFVSPLVYALGIQEGAPPGRQAVRYMNQNIRDRIKPLVQQSGFSKGNAEAVCHMLFAQYMLKRALGQGNLPKSLLNKNYFGLGLRLYQIECAGRGEATPRMFLDAARARGIRLLVPSSSKRRRRKKRPNRRPRPEPNGPGPSPSD